MTAMQVRKLIQPIGRMLLCAIAAMVLFSACSDSKVIQHNYTFTGESENWSAEYQQEASEVFTKRNGRLEYDCDAKGKLTLTYKKDPAQHPPARDISISCSFRMGAVSQSSHSEEGEEQAIQKMYNVTNSSLAREDEVIAVAITIDGQEETMKLTRVR